MSSFPKDLAPIALNENLRNTQRIHRATPHFYVGEPLRATGPEGREVECLAADSPEDIGRRVADVLHRLVVQEHVPASDIAVLVGPSYARPPPIPGLHEDTIAGVALTRDQSSQPNKVLVESIRRFKGLERPVIVLAGIDDIDAGDEKSLMYVGLSRARVYLVVVASAATLQRLGLRG